ncbi:peritrophin-1-like [Ornithodoros turicata]|uniref:peritrophin-1-like n=1 Tax=Ornithodoros turicata TaxID=34597 RepID=UPI00313A4CE8
MKCITTILMLVVAQAYADLGVLECPIVEDENATVTLLPNPYNCSTFYYCAQGQPTLFLCPLGLEFNAEEQVCDYKGRANCVEVEQTAPPTTATNGTPASDEAAPASEEGASVVEVTADVEAKDAPLTKVVTETVPVTKLVTVAVPVTEAVTKVVPVTEAAADAKVEVANEDPAAGLGDTDYLTA